MRRRRNTSRIVAAPTGRRLAAAGLSLLLCCAARGADAVREELAAGAVTVSVEPWRIGLRIVCDGIEVVRHSELVVTTPPWAPHYYLGPTEEAVAGATRTRDGAAESLRLVHRGTAGSFEGVETITLHPEGRVEQVLEARFLKAEGEALIQWRIAALNPTLIVGRKYLGLRSGGGPLAGTVPIVPRAGGRDAATLARGFATLEFDSRLGPLRIDVDCERPLIVYDYRADRWARPEDPYFWFGDLGTRIKAGEAVRYRVIYHLPPALAGMEAPAVEARAEVVRRPDAQLWPQDDPPQIVPRPKEARYGGAPFVLRRPEGGGAALPLCLAREAGEGQERQRRAAGLLADWLESRWRVACAVRAGPPPAGGPAVVFELPGADAHAGEDAYELEVAAEGVVLRAGAERGYLNAVQTLRQLVTVSPEGQVVVRAAEIRDWPALGFRGVHLFTGGRGPELHLRLIREVIAALKMNRLVLQCEYVEWESQPAIHHPEYGMPKDEVRQILDACRALGVEVIPLVMSLGHMQWMFTNDQNLELAEDPEAKWAYCVTDPRTYDFLFSVYAEALELFRPAWLHIGHDEFTHRGRYPYRESSRGYTPEQLFVMDVERLHGWLAGHNVRVMLWGDMLLGEGEGPDACHAASAESAAGLRARVPRDAVIADWHYVGAAPEAFVNLAVFHAAGLQTVAATWYRPENIVNFAQAAWREQALGLLQTTWAGYSLDAASFARERHQYAAYVLAAEAAWNADDPPDARTYPFGEIFLERMGLSALRPANRAGWVADLGAAANTPLAAADADGWFGLGPEHDLAAVPGGDVRCRGVAFRIGGPGGAGGPAAIVLRSKLARDRALPAEVTLMLETTAGQLVLLHATNFPCEVGAKVAEYRLLYADGTSAALEVVYGRNVLAYTDLSALADAPLVWRGRTAAGQPVGLRAAVWEHPHPGRPIRALVLRSADAAGGLMLVGLTGLEAGPAAGPVD